MDDPWLVEPDRKFFELSDEIRIIFTISGSHISRGIAATSLRYFGRRRPKKNKPVVNYCSELARISMTSCQF